MNDIKLSEAIREGIKFYPEKWRGDFFAVTQEGKRAACALGCAVYGRLGVQEIHDLSELTDVYPELADDHPILPDQLKGPLAIKTWLLKDEIIYRNDHLHNTREEIADWLESLGY